MSEEQNLAQAAAAAESRVPRYTFTIPETSRTRPTDPKTVAIRELLYMEEKAGYKAADNGGNNWQYECAMRALYACDGKKLTWDNDEKQTRFESLSQPVRDLVVSAYLKFCVPSKKDREDFFNSVEVEPAPTA
jgi:hypothetical protein